MDADATGTVTVTVLPDDAAAGAQDYAPGRAASATVTVTDQAIITFSGVPEISLEPFTATITFDQPVTDFVLSDTEQDITATQGGTADTPGTPADILSAFMPCDDTAGTDAETPPGRCGSRPRKTGW